MSCQPIKWHGGKGAYRGKLARWIISLMPSHVHYVEPYFGGGAVLFNKNPEGVSEVINDINGQLMNFWRVLASESLYTKFAKQASITPFAEQHWRASKREPGRLAPNGDWRAALRFFVCYRQSRQGLGKDFATMSRNRTRRGMNEQVSSWLTAVEGLPEAHNRLKRVVVQDRDALAVIREQDGKSTCFYLDPPYLHETRATTKDYTYEMTNDQHKTLLKTLKSLEGKFLLSGYRSQLYDSAANKYGWNRHEFQIANNASSKATKDRKTECVWTNF